MSILSFYAGRLMTAENDQLRAENARLRAELEATLAREATLKHNAELIAKMMRPKPVVKKYCVRLDAAPEGGIYDDLKVEFSFTDGKLTGAEVIGEIK